MKTFGRILKCFIHDMCATHGVQLSIPYSVTNANRKKPKRMLNT